MPTEKEDGFSENSAPNVNTYPANDDRLHLETLPPSFEVSDELYQSQSSKEDVDQFEKSIKHPADQKDDKEVSTKVAGEKPEMIASRGVQNEIENDQADISLHEVPAHDKNQNSESVVFKKPNPLIKSGKSRLSLQRQSKIEQNQVNLPNKAPPPTPGFLKMNSSMENNVKVVSKSSTMPVSSDVNEAVDEEIAKNSEHFQSK